MRRSSGAADDQHVELLLGVFALNRASQAERDRIERHLPVCPTCSDSYDEVSCAVSYVSLLTAGDVADILGMADLDSAELRSNSGVIPRV